MSAEMIGAESKKTSRKIKTNGWRIVCVNMRGVIVFPILTLSSRGPREKINKKNLMENKFIYRQFRVIGQRWGNFCLAESTDFPFGLHRFGAFLYGGNFGLRVRAL